MNVKRVQREAKIRHPINTFVFLMSGMIEMHLQINFQRSCMRRIKIGGLPLILTFLVIMSTEVFESLFT